MLQGAVRKPAGILSEHKEILWACSRFLWARNKLVLFFPQHSQSYSDYDSRRCGHCTHHFRPHFIGENIVTWTILVQGLAGLFILYHYGNRGEPMVVGEQSTSLPCLTFQRCSCFQHPPPTSQPVHSLHILQSTAFCKLLHVLIPLSSKCWLLSVYNLLFCDLFVYQRLWTIYLLPGTVLDTGSILATSSPTSRTWGFHLLRAVPYLNCMVNK